jgi:hypothetical protein
LLLNVLTTKSVGDTVPDLPQELLKEKALNTGQLVRQHQALQADAAALQSAVEKSNAELRAARQKAAATDRSQSYSVHLLCSVSPSGRPLHRHSINGAVHRSPRDRKKAEEALAAVRSVAESAQKAAIEARADAESALQSRQEAAAEVAALSRVVKELQDSLRHLQQNQQVLRTARARAGRLWTQPSDALDVEPTK